MRAKCTVQGKLRALDGCAMVVSRGSGCGLMLMLESWVGTGGGSDSGSGSRAVAQQELGAEGREHAKTRIRSDG